MVKKVEILQLLRRRRVLVGTALVNAVVLNLWLDGLLRRVLLLIETLLGSIVGLATSVQVTGSESQQLRINHVVGDGSHRGAPAGLLVVGAMRAPKRVHGG